MKKTWKQLLVVVLILGLTSQSYNGLLIQDIYAVGQTSNRLSNGYFRNDLKDWEIEWSVESQDFEVEYSLRKENGDKYLNLNYKRVALNDTQNSIPAIRHYFTGDIDHDYDVTLQYRVNEMIQSKDYGAKISLSAFKNDLWSNEADIIKIKNEDDTGIWNKSKLGTTFTKLTYETTEGVESLNPCIEISANKLNSIGDSIDIDIKLVKVVDLSDDSPVEEVFEDTSVMMLSVTEPSDSELTNGYFSNNVQDWNFDWSSSNSDFVYSYDVITENDESYLNLKFERVANNNPSDYWPSARHYFDGVINHEYDMTMEYRINELQNSNNIGAMIRLSAVRNDIITGEADYENIDDSYQTDTWLPLNLNATFTQNVYDDDGTDKALNPCVEIYGNDMDVVGNVIDIDIRLVKVKDLSVVAPTPTPTPVPTPTPIPVGSNLLANENFTNGLEGWELDWENSNSDFVTNVYTDQENGEYFMSLEFERIANDNPSDVWPSVRQYFAHEVESKYDANVMYRIREINNVDGNAMGMIRLSAFKNDHFSSDKVYENFYNADANSGWQELDLSTYFSGVYEDEGESVPYNPCLEIYGHNMDKVGNKIKIDIKQPSVVKNEEIAVVDIYESNNSFAEATSIQMGDVLNDLNLDTQLDDDYFKFTIDQEANVDISVINIPDNCDYELYLYDGNHDRIKSSESGENHEEFSVFLTPGDYFIFVDSYSGSSYEYYELSLSSDIQVSQSVSIEGDEYILSDNQVSDHQYHAFINGNSVAENNLVTWSVIGTDKMTFDSDGVLTINSGIEAGTYDVVATLISDNTTTMTKAVTIELDNSNDSTFNYPLSAILDKEYKICISGENIESFDTVVYTINYDSNDLEVVDLIASSYDKETEVGIYEEYGVEFISIELGTIRMKVNKQLAEGYSWSGLINIIKFRAKNNANTIITVVVE